MVWTSYACTLVALKVGLDITPSQDKQPDMEPPVDVCLATGASQRNRTLLWEHMLPAVRSDSFMCEWQRPLSSDIPTFVLDSVICR
eukprot:6484343-Amphidinium_carterae.1